MIDQVFLVTAHMLLHVCAPPRTLYILRRLGRPFPRLKTRGEHRRALSRLQGRGSCLSRALALAARSPNAQVVIGVHLRNGCEFEAHAWLEVQGAPLEPTDPRGQEIVRLATSMG